MMIVSTVNMSTILVGNDKGGVAKDLAAEGLKIALLRAGCDHQIIEFESQKRLGHLYPDTHFIQATAIGADEIYANPDDGPSPSL